MKTVEKLLQLAIDETKNVKTDEIFLVRDLFKGYEWNRLDRRSRLLLGILFLHWVNNSDDGKIVPIEKTSSGQQRYRKG